ncbi:36476_t:CDS:1, partial [Gigaspora margarita]
LSFSITSSDIVCWESSLVLAINYVVTGFMQDKPRLLLYS